MGIVNLNSLVDKTRHARPGWIMIEMVAALGIFAVLLVVLTRTQGQLQRLNAAHWARTRCTAAAQAQLDSIAAKGQPIADAELQRLWPKLTLAIETSPGKGAWPYLSRRQKQI